VVVAKEPLHLGDKIELIHLKMMAIPQVNMPVGAIKSVEEIKGKTLLQHVAMNEILGEKDVSTAVSEQSVTARFKKDFAFTIGEDWLVAKLPDLTTGNKLDVLVTNPKVKSEAT